MFQRVKPVVSISAAVFLLAAAGWALADPCPTEPTIQNFADGLLVVVIDNHLRWIDAMFLANIHRPGRAPFLVAVRRVNHHRKVKLDGQVDLQPEIFILQFGLIVVADFADGDDAVLERETRQDFHDAFRQFLVVGFF